MGPISLKVRDLGGMLSFYEQALGLMELRREGEVVELSAGRSNEPIIVLKDMPAAEKPPVDAAGLYHYAIMVPDRRSLAAAYVSIGKAGVTFDGFADHLVSEALYLTDPEGNGIEIYADRPRDRWRFDEGGYVQMATQPLDIDSLLSELPGRTSDAKALTDGTKLGHVHLKVTDLQRSITFYRTMLGLDLMSYWGSAAFLSVNRYHHHLGMNTWESLGGKPVRKDWAGLENFTLAVPQENLTELSRMLADSPFVQVDGSGKLFVSDPDEIELVVKAT